MSVDRWRQGAFLHSPGGSMASTEQQARAYLDMLDARLRARSSQIALWEDYYEGLHRLQFATSRFRATFGNLFREFADNWCELIVSASVERLKVIGFQTEDGSTQADAEASKIWRDNFMDSEAKIAFTEAVKLGEAYYLIDQENRAYDTDSPLITVEHPAQAICATLPSNRRVRVAGLKEWTEDDGRVCATIYMPDVIYRFQADESGGEQHPGPTASGVQWPTDYLSTPSAGSGSKVTWVPREGVPFVVLNSLKVVPLVPLQNNPTLKVGGRSDIAVVIPLQDAVNKLVTDMIIASEFASFAQRWVTGIEIPRDPETGKALNRQDFLASVARVWAVEDQDAKFGQFQASDLRNYVHAIEMMIQHVAALTRTPPHYLLGQSGNFPSGDSLTATETGLVAKVRGKHSDFNPSNCEMMNLAFRAKGVSGRRCQTTIWGDPEQRIRSQRIDGGIKMTTAGVPQDAVWEEFGTSPEEIERWHQMKTEMGLDPHSTEYAVRPEWETHAEAEKKTPVNTGPQGNLEEQQEATQAARLARIRD